jgi:hypothetical protein
LVERNLAKVEVEGSSPFSRSKDFEMAAIWYHAGIAQLVERNLAKVEVEGSSPFSRSRIRREAWLPFLLM